MCFVPVTPLEAKGFRTYRQSFEIQENRPHTLDIPLIKKPPMPVASGAPANEMQADAGAADSRAPIIVTAPPVVTRVVPNWNLQIISIAKRCNHSFLICLGPFALYKI